MAAMSRRRSADALVIAMVMAVSLAAGCSGDDGTPAAVAPSDAASTSTVAAVTATSTIVTGSTAAGTSTVPSAASPTSTTLPPTTPAPLPTGAPGIDSDDAFCRDYARVLATANLLGVATAFVAQPAEDLLRVEVIASPAQLAAAAVIADEVPESASNEATVLRDDVVGPLVARAAEIDAALVAAGLDDADRSVLVAAWDDVLATDDPGDPAIAVDALPDDVAAVVDAAVAAIGPTLPGYLDDPRTIVDASVVPAVQQYVTTNCPEILGLLGDAD